MTDAIPEAQRLRKERDKYYALLAIAKNGIEDLLDHAIEGEQAHDMIKNILAKIRDSQCQH
jgi:hypothetical protein